MIETLRKGFKIAPQFNIEEQPLEFDDATHRIYLVKNQSTELVIKLIRLDSINKSAFWQVMTDLFNASLLTQFEKFEEIYSSITKISPITTPKLIQKLSISEKKIFASQTTFLPGKVLATSDLNKTMISQLARHLASCHQKTTLPPSSWKTTLRTTLKKQLQKHPEINPKILEQIDERFNKNNFGLIMPDLRWDQFLSDGKQITALIDLDALVMGPIELDWIILEYLLNKQQTAWFIAEYSKFTPPPKIEEVREVYRTLLFTMNILGETSIEQWLKQPLP